MVKHKNLNGFILPKCTAGSQKCIMNACQWHKGDTVATAICYKFISEEESLVDK